MNDFTSTSWAVLAEAHNALRTVVEGVPTDGWSLPTPCESWSVTQVLQHAAGDQLGYASAITGGPGPSENPFAPSGKLTGSAVELVDQAIREATSAIDRIAGDDPAMPTPLPQGALPARIGVGACALDAGVHAWDIAMATGQPNPLSQDLATEFLTVAREIVEPLRAYGAYATALEPVAGDDAVAALMRYLGRNPEWTP